MTALDEVEVKYIRTIPALAAILEGSDHVDVKVVEGEITLREFLAAMSSYAPGWIRFLFRVRAFLATVLRLNQEGVPRPLGLRPEEVPMTPGDVVFLFTVRMAEEDRYWVADTEDHHLKAILGVVTEPLEGRRIRFHVLTVVHYKTWAGPMYFNLIRPFHHLVVRSMARACVGGPASRKAG